MCKLAILLSQLIKIYIALLLVYAVVSWLPSLRGRWTMYLEMIIEPVIEPIRRVVPPLGGIDLSFLIVLLVLQVLSRALVPQACLYL